MCNVYACVSMLVRVHNETAPRVLISTSVLFIKRKRYCKEESGFSSKHQNIHVLYNCLYCSSSLMCLVGGAYL